MDWNSMIEQYKEGEELLHSRISELLAQQKLEGDTCPDLRRRIYLLRVEQGAMLRTVEEMKEYRDRG